MLDVTTIDAIMASEVIRTIAGEDICFYSNERNQQKSQILEMVVLSATLVYLIVQIELLEILTVRV